MLLSITLVQFESTVNSGIIVYMVFVASSFVYGVLYPAKKIHARIIIVLMSVSMFLYWLWVLNHWYGYTALFPLLAFLTGILAFFRRKELKTEWGFLLVLWVDALDSIIENTLKAGWF